MLQKYKKKAKDKKATIIILTLVLSSYMSYILVPFESFFSLNQAWTKTRLELV